MNELIDFILDAPRVFISELKEAYKEFGWSLGFIILLFIYPLIFLPFYFLGYLIYKLTYRDTVTLIIRKKNG
jgi:hypothetical protein